MIEYAQEGRIDFSRVDFDRPFGDPTVDLAPLPLVPWAEAVPPGVDRLPPSPSTAALISGVDRNELSGSDRIALLRTHQRLINHYQAELYRDMVGIRDLYREQTGIDDDLQAAFAAEAEIRAALTWTRRRTEAELGMALDLHRRLPEVIDHMASGDLDVARARVIERTTAELPPETARTVARDLLIDAPRLTTGQLDSTARRRATEVEPELAAERHRAAHARRRVVLEASPDGTGHIHAMDLAPHDAAAVTRRINHLARRAVHADDPRSHDQIKADVFVDVVLGRSDERRSNPPASDTTVHRASRAASPGRADIELRIDLTTLMELDDKPAHIPGYGPVIAEVARDAARRMGDGRWTYVVTDAEEGTPIASGPIRRRPTADQSRTIRATHPTCVFPGCRVPASDSDLDHTTPWTSGGPTSLANLAPLCRHDHRLKSEAGWVYGQDDDGHGGWTSPFGRRYRRGPPP